MIFDIILCALLSIFTDWHKIIYEVWKIFLTFIIRPFRIRNTNEFPYS